MIHLVGISIREFFLNISVDIFRPAIRLSIIHFRKVETPRRLRRGWRKKNNKRGNEVR